MSAHTPGPWSAFTAQVSQFSKTSRGTVAVEQTRAVVAELPARATAETEANARLIAAAPDLLAACQRIADWIEESDGDTGSMVRADAEAVRAAIAKARGE